MEGIQKVEQNPRRVDIVERKKIERRGESMKSAENTSDQYVTCVDSSALASSPPIFLLANTTSKSKYHRRDSIFHLKLYLIVSNPISILIAISIRDRGPGIISPRRRLDIRSPQTPSRCRPSSMGAIE
jgi:hypothetical protein